MMNWNEKGMFNEKGMQDKIIKNKKIFLNWKSQIKQPKTE